MVVFWIEAAVARLSTMAHTCSLDVADDGRHLYRDVAEVLSVRRQRVVEESRVARASMAAALADAGVDR